MPPSDQGDETLLIHALGNAEEPGREGAEWLPLVYDELRSLASSRMAMENDAHTLQATALVHEAWLRLSRRGDRPWRDRAHFFRVAARAMRRVLVEHARQRARLKRGAGQVHVTWDESAIDATTGDQRVLLIDHALEELERVDAEAAQIVTLKFFAGYTTQQVAQITGHSVRNIERIWAHARARLMQIIAEVR